MENKLKDWRIYCLFCKKDITEHVDEQAGKRAGSGTLAKHGKKHYAEMNKKRWDAVREAKAKKAITPQ